jgi:PTH1 family peptidyl-tRNA hydrolase
MVVYDELDLPFGSIRIKPRGGSAGHNGMESVIGAVGSEEFTRIRLGIAPERKVSDGAAYVLKPFRKSQLKEVDDLVSRAADAVVAIVKDGLQAAMNRYNRKPEESS